MTDEKYIETQEDLLLISHLVKHKNLDIDGFLGRISTAEAVGPVLDPVLFVKASNKLTRIKTLAEKIKPFVDELKK